MKKHILNILEILIIVCILELTIFNINSYRLLIGKYQANEYTIAEEGTTTVTTEIDNINTEIATITLDIETDNPVTYTIFYTDQTSSGYRSLPEKVLINEIEKSKSIPCFLSGNTDKLKIELRADSGTNIKFNSVKINEPIPFQFNFTRFLLLSLISIFIYAWKKSEIFNMPYSNKNVKQYAIIFFVTLIFIELLYWCSATSIRGELLNEKNYTHYYLDAIMNGQIELEISPPEELSELKNPYDYIERKENNIKYLYDTAYYNGKYYVYFGILPLITLLLPYKLITNTYMTTDMVVFIYAALASFFMVKTLIAMYKRWFKEIPFKMLITSIIIMLMSSLMLWVCRRPHMYEIAVTAGFYLIMQGVFCMFKAIEKEKVNYIYLALSCTSMALAVACRPTLLLSSILLIPLIVKIFLNNLKEKKNVVKLICAVRYTIYSNWNIINDI